VVNNHKYNTMIRFLLSFLFLLPVCLFAQCEAEDYHSYARMGYLQNDFSAWDMAIKKIMELPAGPEQNYLLARTSFGALGTGFATESEDKMDAYMKLMETALKALLKEQPEHPGGNGLYAGLLGMKIALSPVKGMLLGGKSERYARRGVQYDGSDPIAQYQAGSRFHYTPEMWGGDGKKAVAHLERALAAFSAAEKECDWFYLQTYALLGQAQAAIGERAAARQTYLQALVAEPNFGYVKYLLLPELEKQGK
jgi:tetratricopeptide (TPR) repeat protein